MAGKIIMWVVTFGCWALFFAIGAHAKKLQRPMGFWAGSQVDASRISDVKQYNRENGILWQRYALWYAAAGLAEIRSPILALIILILGGTAGLALLICAYKKIYRKYSIPEKAL